MNIHLMLSLRNFKRKRSCKKTLKNCKRLIKRELIQDNYVIMLEMCALKYGNLSINNNSLPCTFRTWKNDVLPKLANHPMLKKYFKIEFEESYNRLILVLKEEYR